MDATFLPDFCESDSISDSDGDESVALRPRKQRRTNRCFLKQETFENAEKAEEAVAAKKIWSKKGSKETNNGVRVEYRCTAASYRQNLILCNYTNISQKFSYNNFL